MLAWTIYTSFATSLLLFSVPSRSSTSRWVALGGSLAAGIVAVAGCLSLTNPAEFVSIARFQWIPQIGAEYHLAADGISAAMILLTAIASVAGILFSWNIEHRVNHFFGFYQLLIGGVYGVFLSADLLLFFVFYEIAIVPKYFLIAIWGSTRREYGAMKLALYSFGGSALLLVGILAAYVMSGTATFNLATLAASTYSPALQSWAFPVTFLGFAILAGLWPFHTWAPTGHAAAPTAASMLLAGVVMKLGAYGALRVAMTLYPIGLHQWSNAIALFAVIGIVFGAAIALTQTDFKYVIGYSSVSHMGFVLLGLSTASTLGVSGAVLQMFSHGIIAGLLFAVAGRMVYERTHTRDLNELGLLRLDKRLPFAGLIFLLASCASMGLPGFSGFVAELTILIATWQGFPIAAIFTAIGILIGVAFTIRALVKVFYSDAPLTDSIALPPITWPEKVAAILLLATTLAIGLYPRLLMDYITPAVNSGITAQALHRSP